MVNQLLQKDLKKGPALWRKKLLSSFQAVAELILFSFILICTVSVTVTVGLRIQAPKNLVWLPGDAVRSKQMTWKCSPASLYSSKMLGCSELLFTEAVHLPRRGWLWVGHVWAHMRCLWTEAHCWDRRIRPTHCSNRRHEWESWDQALHMHLVYASPITCCSSASLVSGHVTAVWSMF